MSAVEATKASASIRFRLIDGTDIGPKAFPLTTLVSAVKEAVLAEWPQTKVDLLICRSISPDLLHFYFFFIIILNFDSDGLRRYRTGGERSHRRYRVKAYTRWARAGQRGNARRRKDTCVRAVHDARRILAQGA